MASSILRRQLARASTRLSPSTASASTSFLARRTLSTTSKANAEPALDPIGAKRVLESHTVEDLHGMHPTEILAETGTQKDAQLRHFTGMWSLGPCAYGSSLMMCTILQSTLGMLLLFRHGL